MTSEPIDPARMEDIRNLIKPGNEVDLIKWGPLAIWLLLAEVDRLTVENVELRMRLGE